MDRIEYEKSCLKLAKAKLRKAKAAQKRDISGNTLVHADSSSRLQAEVDRAQYHVDVIKRRIAELEG